MKFKLYDKILDKIYDNGILEDGTMVVLGMDGRLQFSDDGETYKHEDFEIIFECDKCLNNINRQKLELYEEMKEFLKEASKCIESYIDICDLELEGKSSELNQNIKEILYRIKKIEEIIK